MTGFHRPTENGAGTSRETKTDGAFRSPRERATRRARVAARGSAVVLNDRRSRATAMYPHPNRTAPANRPTAQTQAARVPPSCHQADARRTTGLLGIRSSAISRAACERPGRVGRLDVAASGASTCGAARAFTAAGLAEVRCGAALAHAGSGADENGETPGLFVEETSPAIVEAGASSICCGPGIVI
jgi:hypothetical protein